MMETCIFCEGDSDREESMFCSDECMENWLEEHKNELPRVGDKVRHCGNDMEATVLSIDGENAHVREDSGEEIYYFIPCLSKYN